MTTETSIALPIMPEISTRRRSTRPALLHAVLLAALALLVSSLAPRAIAAETQPASATSQAASPASTDWPTWRGNAGRTAAGPAEFPLSFSLSWSRKLGSPIPAWPASQGKLRFDASYEPIVAGKRLFVASMVADRLAAYDTQTGQELWRFYAQGPIRFAPLAWRDNVYCVSDDGLLHCLDAATGKPRWSLRGGPDARLALGNERLISVWPARGAPVLWEDAKSGSATLYFAASIWPFMGTFIHAVDARTGAIVWTNSGTGADYTVQQHNTPAFAGVAPQGYFSASDDVLLVSGGRTVPAAYNRRTGAFLYFNVSSRVFEKSSGGYGSTIVGNCFLNGGDLYGLGNGEPAVKGPLQVLGDVAVSTTDAGLQLFGFPAVRTEEAGKDRHGNDEVRVSYSLPPRGPLKSALPLKRFHFVAGDRVFGSGDGGRIGAVPLPPVPGKSAAAGNAAPPWSAQVEGEVFSMVPGDSKLFVVTAAGTISCFAADAGTASAPAAESKPIVHELPAPESAAKGPGPEGYAMIWGANDATFENVKTLAKDYFVIVIAPQAERVDALRRQLDDAGIYGRRSQVLLGSPATMKLPPYVASRIEINDVGSLGAEGEALARAAFHCLRPYGGRILFAGDEAQRGQLAKAFAAAALPGAKIANAEGQVEVRREGALPGSAPWTHQYADVANSVVSRDDLVKPPLGLLWFGGPSNDAILPRHGHGPTPQVIGGRLIIEGPNMLRSIDAYTGRLLWQRPFEGLGKFYDNTAHQPGAGEIGSNYVSQADAIYLVYQRQCLKLDPATGLTLATFEMPHEPGQQPPHWGYIGVYENLLIATGSPVTVRGGNEAPGTAGAAAAAPAKPQVRDEDHAADDDSAGPLRVDRDVAYASASERLVVMDRQAGKVLWKRDAQQMFRHNAVVAGEGKVFCIDAVPPAKLELLRRRGEEPKLPPVLLALDAKTGEVVWKAEKQVGGTWLGYSEEHHLLLAGGSPARDRAKDEAGTGMAVYKSGTGEPVWRRDFKYVGTPILHGSTVYTDGAGVDLLTGKPLRLANPITGQPTDWTFSRGYGCNTPIGGQHMLLFRSAAAGFCDLGTHAGTANWGGFKSSCTANLIPADGILVAPDFTRTCTCSYQNQSSLALVSMPDVEVWTAQSYDQIAGPVQRVGINLGAPGDWTSPEGTLWIDFPSVGGKSPKLQVDLQGPARFFRRHSMEVQGPSPQVTASGAEFAGSLRVNLGGEAPRAYTVRLFFAEPDAVAAGQRVFDVLLQGKPAATGLDVFAETGGTRRGLVKEFKGVSVRDALQVELRPAAGSKRPPILCGVEAVREP
ncbi:MAG: PQQ-binding-like beta-propeller repeat protein [Planctomycetota bacterium]|nr:PQQ-binding-like beta-propeller repeat protein [Planctomycetota bacterium]